MGTGYAVILLGGEGERSILAYRGASSSFKEGDISFKKLSSKAVYIAPGRISFNVMSKLVNHFKDSGALVAMNPSGHYISMGMKKLKPIFKKLDVVIMNREEGAKLTKVDYKDENRIFSKLDEVVDGIAVMTDGPRGSLVSDGFDVHRAGVFPEKKLVDRTGAGDAFGSGFVAGIVESKGDICHALRVASANATSVVEHVGAQEGALSHKDLSSKRWKYLDLDVEKKRRLDIPATAA